MSAYNPPNFDLPIFDSQAFIDVNTSEFLEFPTAQGLETFPNGLIGNLTGNATSASTITTANSTENVAHYLNFSNNSATGVGTVQKTVGLSCNPSANTISATTFIGDLSGNAVTSTRATNIAGGLVGQIPYQTGANTTAFLANTTANVNYVLTATAAGVIGYRPDFSNVIAVLNNSTNNTRTIVTGDYFNLILFNQTTTVTMPATNPANNTYIRFSIRGNAQTLTVQTSAPVTILTLTTGGTAQGTAGVTLMYSTTASYTGWFVVQ
jgi:hypothetical protein